MVRENRVETVTAGVAVAYWHPAVEDGAWSHHWVQLGAGEALERVGEPQAVLSHKRSLGYTAWILDRTPLAEAVDCWDPDQTASAVGEAGTVGPAA